MKLLLVLFLVGFALVSAGPVPSHDLALNSAEDLDTLFDFAEEADDELKTELGKKLKEYLNDILKKFKEANEKGQSIKQETLEKFREVYRIFKGLGTDIKIKFRELKDLITEIVKEYFKNIWHIIRPKNEKRSINDVEGLFADDDELKTKLGKNLKEILDDILKKFKDANEKGQRIKQETLDKLKEIRRIIKSLGTDAKIKFTELKDLFKEILKEYWTNLLNIIRNKNEKQSINDVEVLFADDDDLKTEFGKKLKEYLDDLLKKIREANEKGQKVKQETIEKFHEVLRLFKGLGTDMKIKFRELFDTLKDIIKEYLRNITNIFRPKNEKRTKNDVEVLFADDPDFPTKFFNFVKEFLTKVLKEGKEINEATLEKIREFVRVLKGLGVDVKLKIREVLDQIKDISSDYKQRILDIFNEYEPETEFFKKTKERIEELMKKIQDKYEKGKIIAEEKLKELKELFKKLEEKKEELGEKGKEIYAKLKEKVRNFFDRFTKKTEQKRFIEHLVDILREFRQKIHDGLDSEEIKKKIDIFFEKGSNVAELLKNKLKGGKQAFFNFIDGITGFKKEEKRSFKDAYEKFKEFFNKLVEGLKEKYTKFGEWAKEKFEKIMAKGKSKMETFQEFSKEFIKEAESMNKDAVKEAREFFRECKEDFRNIYDDIEETIKKILSKN